MTDSSTVLGRYYVQNLVTNKSHSDLAIKSSAGYYGLFQLGGDRKDALVAAGREWAEQQGKENFETAEDPSFAALLWAASFERCSTNKYTENGIIYFTDLQLQQERYDRARIIYEEFCGNGANE